MTHRTRDELDAAIDDIAASPADVGTLHLIVRRPAAGERDVLDEAELDVTVGLVGDTWKDRSSSRMPDGGPHPDMQLNLINARASAFIAIDPERRALAGDQLHVDLDLSLANLPAGTRLRVGDGSAMIEVTDQPHTGCAKFTERFGLDAMRWVNSERGRQLNLRGINAKVVTPGVIRTGDLLRKL